MTGSPYDGLDARAYWRTGVATRGPGRLRGLYDPRVVIGPQTRVLTAGSCFAQHVHRALLVAGFAVIDTEPAPDGVDPEVARRFFYGSFSARYGNVYTARQFRQLLDEAAGTHTPAHPVWSRAGRFYDALRPNTDPGGYASAAAVGAARADHLAAVAQAVAQADVVIFTLGLTETWEDRATGTVYPTAPGVIADAPDGAEIGFVALGHDAVVSDMRAALARLRAINPAVQLILTVSPVPLTATATGGHVLVASSASKAILRAAVETLMADDAGIDYFPSYEIITNPAARSAFFGPNLRNPTPKGVSVVMGQFLAAQQAAQAAGALIAPKVAATGQPKAVVTDADEDNAAICEEQMNDPGQKVAARTSGSVKASSGAKASATASPGRKGTGEPTTKPAAKPAARATSSSRSRSTAKPASSPTRRG